MTYLPYVPEKDVTRIFNKINQNVHEDVFKICDHVFMSSYFKLGDVQLEVEGGQYYLVSTLEHGISTKA